jgi:hypothetical protein
MRTWVGLPSTPGELQKEQSDEEARPYMNKRSGRRCRLRRSEARINLCWVSVDVDGSAECMRSFIFAGAGIGGEDGIDVRLGEAGGGSG